MRINHINQKGAAMMLFVIFFSFAVSAIIFTLNKSVLVDLRDFSNLARAKASYLTAESGLEDVVYRLRIGTFSVDTTEPITLYGVSATTTTIYDLGLDEYTILSESEHNLVIRKSEIMLAVTSGSAFSYGLQSGNGGISLSNNSDIFGNVYSNGTVQGAGSATVFGEIVSAGPTGLIADITATGSVYANTIDNVDAGIDAHYNIDLGSSNITGVRYTPVTVEPTIALPISTTSIQEWKDAIVNYGTTIAPTDPECLSGTYTINTNITIGYLKVECDLDIVKTGPSTVVTLDGPIWVEGNLSFTQGPEIVIDNSLGRRSVQMIADNESNRLTSSKIEIRNSTNFSGTGHDSSYVMLLSQNESASSSGSEVAIDIGQSINGDVFVYSNGGLIDIGNNIDLRSVTGYQINVANGSSITYESGLANLVFTSGPGGDYEIVDWQQVE